MSITTARKELAKRLSSDAGASTAEYAITILAACAFAAVLFGVLTSGGIKELLIKIITTALGSAG